MNRAFTLALGIPAVILGAALYAVVAILEAIKRWTE